jgi:TolB-like protein
MPQGAPYRLKLLGAFGLYGPDGERVRVTSKKGMALIALVAMARGGERTRSWLQDQLWGSRPLEQGQASLRRELANLRAVLANDAAEPLLTADMVRVRLDLSQIEVDVRELESNLADEARIGAVDEGEFLEGLDLPGEEGFEDWLRSQRQLVAEVVEQARVRQWKQQMLASQEESDAPSQPPVSAAVALASGRSPSLPDRPSIAVLPFATAGSGDEDIGAGVAEEIGISLSRFSTLLVVQGGAVPDSDQLEDRSRLCRDLGVRYLLEGSVRRSGGELRVVVRLVDGVVGEQLWAERFDGRIEELFALQERVAGKVAPLIDASIDIAERQHAMAAPVQSADAYQLYWRANALFRRWEREPMLEAIGLAEQILEIEPRNAWAAAMAAFCHSVTLNFGWTEDPAATRAAAMRFYELAMRSGGDDPFVLGYAAGTLLGIGGDLDVADALIDRALAIHPDMPASLFWGGWTDIARGNVPRAQDRFEKALRLNPRSAVRPHSLTGIGICLLALGRAEEGACVLTSAVQQLSHHPLTLAALAGALARLGRHEEAQRYARRLEEIGGIGAVANVLRAPQLRALLGEGAGSPPVA